MFYIECKICGTIFETGRRSSCYCGPVCAKKGHGQKQAEYRARNPLKKPTAHRRRTKKEPMLRIAQVEQLARDEGVSYGAMTALLFARTQKMQSDIR